jgi:hypothetical protein
MTGDARRPLVVTPTRGRHKIHIGPQSTRKETLYHRWGISVSHAINTERGTAGVEAQFRDMMEKRAANHAKQVLKRAGYITR